MLKIFFEKMLQKNLTFSKEEQFIKKMLTIILIWRILISRVLLIKQA